MCSDVSGDPVLLRSYLLGELVEAEADALEIRLLNDDALFELAEAVEGDLLAAFARGDLAVDDGQKVVRRLAASPRGRARLALAEGLTSQAQALPRAPLPFRPRVPQAERPVFRFAAMAAGVLVTAGGVWLALQIAHLGNAPFNRLPSPLPKTMPVPLSSPPPEQTPSAHIAAKAPAKPAPRRSRVVPAFVFELALSTTRSAEQPRPVMTIPAGTQRVEIRLPLDEGLGDSFKTYRAAVLDAASGTEVWSQESLKPRAGKEGPLVVLSLPAAKLPEGQYQVDLRGHGEDGALEPVRNQLISVRR